MGNYKLSKDAENDLIRIHQYGIIKYGEVQADNYYFAFFNRFEKIAQQPYLYQAVDHIRKDYRHSVCGRDTIYYRIVKDNIEIMNIIGQQNIEE